VSENYQITITITAEHWDDDDQDWLKERLTAAVVGMLYKGDYLIEESRP
jgi:hypothetical protein